MRLLKRLSKLINMFGASLQCTVWQGHKCPDELWSRCKQGGIQLRGTCAKRQSNRNIWPFQPLMTGSWFFSYPSSFTYPRYWPIHGFGYKAIPTHTNISAVEDGDDEEEEKVEEEEEIYKLKTLWSLDTVIDFPPVTMAMMMIVWAVSLIRWNGYNEWTGEIVISGAMFHIVQLKVWHRALPCQQKV